MIEPQPNLQSKSNIPLCCIFTKPSHQSIKLALTRVPYRLFRMPHGRAFLGPRSHETTP